MIQQKLYCTTVVFSALVAIQHYLRMQSHDFRLDKFF